MLTRFVAVLALCFVALAARTLRLQAFAAHQDAERHEDVYYLPPPDWLPTMSFGYTSALADLLWCRSLVYFGEELAHRSPAKNVLRYTDAILALDPTLRAAYRWAATGIGYRLVPPTVEEVTQASEYLKRAVERWPNDGELRWDLASYLRFELGPRLSDDPARKERVLAEAVPHMHAAVLKGAGPPWLALNNATLLSKLGQKEHAIRQLEEVYPTLNDEAVRAQIRQRLAQLRSDSYAEAVQVAAEQFEEERQANFPYLDGDLFLLVGPKVAPAYPSAVANLFAPAEMDQASK